VIIEIGAFLVDIKRIQDVVRVVNILKGVKKVSNISKGDL
jgi:hypothetical protein